MFYFSGLKQCRFRASQKYLPETCCFWCNSSFVYFTNTHSLPLMSIFLHTVYNVYLACLIMHSKLHTLNLANTHFIAVCFLYLLSKVHDVMIIQCHFVLTVWYTVILVLLVSSSNVICSLCTPQCNPSSLSPWGEFKKLSTHGFINIKLIFLSDTCLSSFTVWLKETARRGSEGGQ